MKNLFKNLLFTLNVLLLVLLILLSVSINPNSTNLPSFAKKTLAAVQGILGEGTVNYLAAFTGANQIGNSIIYDTGTNVGIGTTEPNQKLHIVGIGYATGDFRAQIFYDTNNTSYYVDPNGTSKLNAAEFAGNVGIRGPGSASVAMHVEGQINGINGIYGSGRSYGVFGSSSGGSGVYGYSPAFYGVSGYSPGTSGAGVKGSGYSGVVAKGSGWDFYATGSGVDYGSSSSVRWKNNIVGINNALSKVLRLRGVYFDWDKEHGGGYDMGMVAEEVGKIIPEIVVWDKDAPGYATGMDYSKLTPVLIEAVKEQQKQIDVQQKQIDELKAEIDNLKK